MKVSQFNLIVLGFFLAQFLSCRYGHKNKQPILTKLCEITSTGREEIFHNSKTSTLLKYNSYNESKPLLLSDNGSILKEFPRFQTSSAIFEAFYFDTFNFYTLNFDTELVKYDKNLNIVHTQNFRSFLKQSDTALFSKYEGLEPMGEISQMYMNGYVILQAFSKKKFVRTTKELIKNRIESCLLKFHIRNDSIVRMEKLSYELDDFLGNCDLASYFRLTHLRDDTFAFTSRSFPSIHIADIKQGISIASYPIINNSVCEQCKSENIQDILKYTEYTLEHCPFIYKVIRTSNGNIYLILVEAKKSVVNGIRTTPEEFSWKIYNLKPDNKLQVIFSAGPNLYDCVSTVISNEKVFIKEFPNEGKANIYSFDLNK